MNSTTTRSRARSAIRFAALFGTASFLAMAASGAARAQGQAQAQNSDMVPEQVLITGSLISGAVAVGVPVSDLRPADFVETGKLSITEILKSVPALRIDAEASPTYGGGTLSFLQNVQIHGLGTGSGVETLLLVNGLRWPPQNYSNDTVNPSIIPQIALERIDVLSAGASAVYGSDATAGVINLILRRGYDGAMTQASVTSAPSIGYLSEQISQLYGKSWEGGNVTVSYAFTDSRPVSASRRSYYTQDFSPWGLMDITPIGSSIPGIAHGGANNNAANAANISSYPGDPTKPLPALETAASGTMFCANCFSIPKNQNGVGLTWAAITANPGVKNERNPWIDSDARPRLQTNAVTGTLDQQLTNDLFGLGPVALFADGFYSNQRGKQIYTPGNGQARNVLETNLTVPTNNPFRPTGAPAVVKVDYSFALEVPTFITGGEVATHWDFGFNLDKLPFDWQGKLTYSMSDDRNYGDATNSINKNNLLAALGNTVSIPATSTTAAYTFVKPSAVPYLNIFCDPMAFTCNDPATLSYIVGYRLQHETFKVQETGFNFNGPVFDLPGGPIRLAIAGQTLREHWTYLNLENDNTDSTAVITNSLDSAWQYSYAFFGQADIPIFGEANAVPFIQSLVVELGYRYDKYNNLADPVYTPKAAVNWGVGGGLTLRGAWGKSFRVPSFAENSPFGSRVAGQNRLGGFANSTNVTVLDCASVNGSKPGVALPGSLTALLNPTCLTDEAHVSPGGISVELSGNGAAALLRGHGLSSQTLSQWSTGFNLAPTESYFGVNLSGLNVDVSWFRLEFKGLISSNALGIGGNDPVSFARYTVIPNPNLPITDPSNKSFLDLVTALAAVPQRSGFVFDPVNIPNIKFIQDSALTNLGSRVFSGIDFDARYDFDLANVGLTNAGSINIGAAGFYETIDKSRANDTSALVHVFEGKDSGNHLQRVRYRLGWSDDTWSVTAFANYFGHGANTATLGVNFPGNNLIPPCFYTAATTAGSCFPGSQHFGPYLTYPNMSPATVYFDLTVGYQTGEMPANTYLRNIGVQFTINDIFDKPPPFQVGARNNGSIRAFDNSFPDLQRTFTLTLTKVW
ncbi:MAG TPA: TonB-dependent receptor [Micropepsaceae bacterium]|nr:TonB-dependent receptor [Micropepsaceae bacterium]